MGQFRSGFIVVIAAAFVTTTALAGPLDDAKRAAARADFGTVLKLAMPLAKAGDPVAQEMIGELYESGITVKRDYTRAFVWYRRAAAQGNTTSETRLGFMYAWGHGVARDIPVAVSHFRLAAERGDPVAAAWLGLAYQVGDNVPQDDEQSDFWRRKAAEHGDPLAAWSLLQIWMYNPGPNPPKDYGKADARARKAAAEGAAYAEYILAVRYRDGLHVAADHALAQVWMRKAAEQGYGRAEYELGRMTVDKKEAGQWYVKAFAHGEPLALAPLLHACGRDEVTGAVCNQADAISARESRP